MRWPAWELDLMEHYLAMQPSASDRVEVALATLCAMFANANRGRNGAEAKVTDFLPYLYPWGKPAVVDMSRYNEADQSILAALGAVGR